MWLSKITLKDTADLRTLASLGDTEEGYRIHQYVWKFFSRSQDQKRDFLFRKDDQHGKPMFYTISKEPPLEDLPSWNTEKREYAPHLKPGDVLSFLLRVNPVVTKNPHDEKNPNKRIRHDVLMDAKVKAGFKEMKEEDKPFVLELERKVGLDWLKSQAERHGFSFDDKKVIVEGYRQHRLWKGKQKEAIRFSTLDFRGLLTVTSPEDFQKSLFTGIGPAKAFGCGLLLVRRG